MRAIEEKPPEPGCEIPGLGGGAGANEPTPVGVVVVLPPAEPGRDGSPICRAPAAA